jgi:hypothetical protein
VTEGMLDADADTAIRLSVSELFNRFYATFRSMTFHVDCGRNLGWILENNLIIFCTFFLISLPLSICAVSVQ